MVKALPLLTLTLCACDRDNPDQPLGGVRYETELGFVFWWTGPGLDDTATPERASATIDELAVQWATADARRDIRSAKMLPIQLLPAQRVNDDGDHVSAVTYFGRKIVVATLADRWDSACGRWFRGLEILIHEWDHVQFGDWHPKNFEEIPLSGAALAGCGPHLSSSTPAAAVQETIAALELEGRNALWRAAGSLTDSSRPVAAARHSGTYHGARAKARTSGSVSMAMVAGGWKGRVDEGLVGEGKC